MAQPSESEGLNSDENIFLRKVRVNLYLVENFFRSAIGR